MEMSSASTEYVVVPVTTAPVNVTSGTVMIAFLPRSTDPDDDTEWLSADWVVDADPAAAQILVGPEGEVLAQGIWRPWLKISGFDPELPVLPAAGTVRIL